MGIANIVDQKQGTDYLYPVFSTPYMEKALTQCGSGCRFHNRLSHNLIRIFAEKNLSLSNRMAHRDSRFTIPFSRQQLWEYLCVDRSTLSNELSKMQKERLLTFCKNEFALSTDIREKT